MRRLGAVELLALTAVLRAPSVVRPYLSDDEAIYAAVGRAMSHGARVYADVVDHKPPAIYWVYDLAHRLASPAVAMLVMHVAIALTVWATALTLGRIAKCVAPDVPDADGIAALLYVVFTTTMMPFDSLAANAELWMMLPASLSMLIVLQRDDLAGAFSAGVLLSIAGAFKYQAAVQAPVLIGMLAFDARVAAPRRASNVAAALAGLALPWVAIIAYFRSSGTLGEALYWFRFNFAYIDAGSARGELIRRAALRIAFAVLPAMLLYASAIGGLRRRGARWHWMIAWTVLSALAVSAGGRFFGHYFHQLTAPLAVLAAPGLASIVARHRRAAVFALVFPVLGFWVVAWTHGVVMRDVVHHPEPDYAAVAAWLDARDPARGSLCVWGNSPALVALANRPLGCRFVSANFLTGISPATATQQDPNVDPSKNVVPGMWSRFLADLDTRKPVFIVDGSPGNVEYFGKAPPEKYPALAGILRRDYEVVGLVEGMRIFRRRPGV